MKTSVFLICVFILTGLLNNCKKESETATLDCRVVSNTLCREIILDLNNGSNTINRNESWIFFTYDNSTKTLKISHKNAGFNCCPGTFSVEVTNQGNCLTIDEKEELPGCHCLCLYDIDLEIYNVQPTSYKLKILELYIGDHNPLVGIIDLKNCTAGSFYIVRDFYPWGI